MKPKKEKVSNERKQLYRLTGEFVVASKLCRQGILISLQWGTTIGYDILAYDRNGKTYFIEVKVGAAKKLSWLLQYKYSGLRNDSIPAEKRLVACIDISDSNIEPILYLFPANVVSEGLKYYFNNKFPKSPSLNFSLNNKPIRKKGVEIKTVGEYINAEKYRENFKQLNLDRIIK